MDIQVEHISKSYSKGRVSALKDISFEVKQGELFGLIGPDGAGKTTLFRILTTLLFPDSGHARVGGFDVVADYREIRKRVGYMPGRFSLYQDLSVEENLHFFATVFGTTIAKNYEFIKDIYEQLAPFKDRRAGKLSGGMKQKLALCCALIHRPEVLFLDEPTTGVDAVSRKEFWEMLKNLKKEGITILVSTPYMDEATLCERIALIQEGRIMKINTPQGIIQSYPEKLYAIRAKDMIGLLAYLQTSPQISSVYAFGEHHHITLKVTPEEALKMLSEKFQNIELQEITPGIEDSFIQLMTTQHG